MQNGLFSKPLINVYWEKILEKDINEFRQEMGIQPPPDLRNMRKEFFAMKRKEKELKQQGLK